MIRTRKWGVLVALVTLGAAAYWSGVGQAALDMLSGKIAAHMGAPETNKSDPATDKPPMTPSVSVTPVVIRDFTETVLVTGTLVPRDEILVAPEVEGLRVLDLKVDESDRVTKGQVLATLVADSLDAQVAENDAQLARATAAIAQARSQIVEAEAREREAAKALDRAQPLRKQGWIAESTVDQRQSVASATRAQVLATRDGLKLAEAEKAQVEARRRELEWRRGNIEVKSPADGIVSRRTARIGGMALAAGEPMFRIIARGEIELDAEVPEADMAKLATGQTAVLDVAGGIRAEGQVRLISPEINSTTRLGKVRVFLGEQPGLRIGAFASGMIKTASARGLSVPVSALSTTAGTVTAQVVTGDRVETRTLKTGLTSDGQMEVKDGLKEGEFVVVRAGSFLRDGDTVRPVLPDAGKVSTAQ